MAQACTASLDLVGLSQQIRFMKICMDHPELWGQLDSVEQTLRAPSVITADAHHANRECFYLQGSLPGKSREYLKVVVEFEDDRSDGKIITAYSDTRLPSVEEEARIWPT